jgi:GDP-L-fucose synthase
MDTILVTGGSGLVGSAIQAIVKNYSKYKFIFINSSDCDLTNYDKTLIYFTKIHPSYIIHLAANVGGLFKNISQKVDMYEKNMMINFNVIKIAHIIGVKKMISCLSTCVFPDKTSYPMNEFMLHNGPPHYSNDAYAYAKRMIEIHSKIYNEQYGTNFICVIPTNIYGKNDNFNLKDAHVIPALIHKCYLAKMNNQDFIVAGSGKPLRQFIYSKDLAKLILWCLESYNEKSSLILSPDESDEISIGDIAKIIAKKFDYYERLIFDKTRSDGQFKKTVDNSKLISLYPDFQFTNINHGIEKTIEWFITNYNICRK